MIKETTGAVEMKPVPNKAIKIWPVLKLAVNRTANVSGRTNSLTNSITHRKGFKRVGEPDGWRWARKEEILYALLIKTTANQVGRERARLIDKCLVSLKTNGTNPIKLRVTKIIKSLINREEDPPIILASVRETKSSTIAIALVTMAIKKEDLDQRIWVTNKIMVKDNPQIK